MDVFEISKNFPKEEVYSATSQIRRCSRSVCANFAEAFRRQNYIAHFLSKLTDSDAENSETSVWLDFCFACKYISKEKYQDLVSQQISIGNLIGDIIKNPKKYISKKSS